MSSRQIRKLQRQRELEQAKLQIEQEAQEEQELEEEEDVPVRTKPSGFANFALLQQEEEEPEEDEDEDEPAAEEEVIEPAPPKSKSKKSKKSKSKKKKAEAEADTEPTASNNGPDEIDAALEALNLSPNTMKYVSAESDNASRTKNVEYDRICSLLGISTQHLKVGNEMRSLFGRTATGNHEDAGGAVPRAGRRAQRQNQQVDLETALKGQHAPGKGLPEVTLRRNPFIQGKDEWPKAPAGGLTMAVVDNNESMDGTIEFKFVHNNEYNAVQQEFQQFVQMGDPTNLIALLTKNPYNISLLLQVSKVAKDQGDHALSSDLIERALFTFGRATISSFTAKLQTGKARLDFARPENRELWLAGYHYIKSLMMKGTYRTALEWAKLLFALSPEEDHYCMKLMIHHLAVRSYQSDWLLDISDTSIFEVVSPYSTPSVALAAMQAKNSAKSKEILRKGIKDYPWLFCMLFQELNIDPPPSIWGSLPKTDSDSLFAGIYIRQTKDIWNTPEAMSLLKEVALAAPKLAAYITPMRVEVTLDIARYVYLDGTRELMTLLPKDLLYRQPNSDSDPLPPSLGNNLFSHDSQRVQFESFSGAGNHGLGEQANLLHAMLDLMPEWLHRERLHRNRRREFPPGDPDSEGDSGEDDENEDEDEDDDDDDDEESERRLFLEHIAGLMPGRFPDDDGDEDEDGEDGGINGAPPGSFARMYAFMSEMFASGRFAGPGVGEVDEADTDEDMPPLVDSDDMPNLVDSDDDMPPLV